MQPVTIWYAIQANDGMECDISWHLSRDTAEIDDVADDDDYGDVLIGSIETYIGSETYLKAR